MKKYKYPKEVTDENFQKLVTRAKTISRKSAFTLGVAMLVSLVSIFLFIFFLAPSLRAINDPSITASVALVISLGVSLFVSVFLIEAVNVFLRRVFNNFVSYYPSPEEFVFAQCILTANLYSEKKRVGATIKAKSLCSELSNFTRYDPLNFRRNFYKNEFRLLTSGKNQIGRMLLFSEAKVKELLSNFALALVNHDDPKAYLYLKRILKEVKKFGKIEGWQKRIESKVKSLKGIMGIIATIVTIAGILWGMFG